VTEATCKAALARLLRKSLVPRGGIVYRHEDQFTGGIPDVSLSLDGFTVWAEVKLHRPGRKAKTTALQTAALIALRGLLVEYAVHPRGRLTVVVRSTWSGREVCLILCPSRAKDVHLVVAGVLISRLERREW